jgi:hypothetical protein
MRDALGLAGSGAVRGATSRLVRDVLERGEASRHGGERGSKVAPARRERGIAIHGRSAGERVLACAFRLGRDRDHIAGQGGFTDG